VAARAVVGGGNDSHARHSRAPPTHGERLTVRENDDRRVDVVERSRLHRRRRPGRAASPAGTMLGRIGELVGPSDDDDLRPRSQAFQNAREQ
jgi:hypothetical protein